MNVVLSVEALRPPLAGIGRYVWELATRLPNAPEIDHLRLISDGFWRDPARVLPIAASTDEHREPHQSASYTKPSPWRQGLAQLPFISKAYTHCQPLLTAYRLRSLKNGIFHGPNFFLPKTDLPSVVTIHDLSTFRNPSWHPQTRIDRMRAMLPLALARASVVLTDSEATKLELQSEFNLDAGRICAVPLGVDAQFRPRDAATLLPVLRHYGLQVGGYSLFVSTIEPRKNILNLIEAYRSLPVSVRAHWPLVLVGAQGWNSQAIHAAIARAEAEGWLHYLDYVAQHDLPYLYAGCRLFTYPSHYEGFGLPIAEAMASGVPVLTSDCSSMPEVAAGAALLVQPLDVADIAQALERGLQDEVWREQAIVRGLQRAQELTWHACVAQTVQAYQMAQTQRKAWGDLHS